MSRWTGWMGGWLAGAVLLAGCDNGAPPGAKPTKPVKVTIMYKGAPVADAAVTFVPDGDPVAAYGKTDAQGVAKMKTYVEGDGAVLGNHTITVIKDETIGEAASVDQDSPEYKPPTGNEPPPTIKHHVPPKYSSIVSSDLKAEVTSGGPNDFTFELNDSPPSSGGARGL